MAMAGATLVVRDSPDDSQTGVNLRALPAIQQDMRCRRLPKADKHQSFLSFNRRAKLSTNFSYSAAISQEWHENPDPLPRPLKEDSTRLPHTS
jgi:hypothetical protein